MSNLIDWHWYKQGSLAPGTNHKHGYCFFDSSLLLFTAIPCKDANTHPDEKTTHLVSDIHKDTYIIRKTVCMIICYFRVLGPLNPSWSLHVVYQVYRCIHVILVPSRPHCTEQLQTCERTALGVATEASPLLLSFLLTFTTCFFS